MTAVAKVMDNVRWYGPDGIQGPWQSNPSIAISSRIWVDNARYGASPISVGGQQFNMVHIEVHDGDQYGGSSGSRVMPQWTKEGLSAQAELQFRDGDVGTESWYFGSFAVPSGQPGVYFVYAENTHNANQPVGSVLPKVTIYQAPIHWFINTGTQKLGFAVNTGDMRTNYMGTTQFTHDAFPFHYDTIVRWIVRVVYSMTGTGKIQMWATESATWPAFANPTYDSSVVLGSLHDTVQYIDGFQIDNDSQNAALAGVSRGYAQFIHGIYRTSISPGFTTFLYSGGMGLVQGAPDSATAYATAVAVFSGSVAPSSPPPSFPAPAATRYVGKPTDGTNTWTFSQDRVYLQHAVLPESGIPKSVQFYLPTNGAATAHVKPVVYLDDGSVAGGYGMPGALLCQGSEVTVAASTTPLWTTMPLTPPAAQPAGTKLHFGIHVGAGGPLTDRGEVSAGSSREIAQTYASGVPTTGATASVSGAFVTVVLEYDLGDAVVGTALNGAMATRSDLFAFLTVGGVPTVPASRVAFVAREVATTILIWDTYEILDPNSGEVGGRVVWDPGLSSFKYPS